MGCAGLRRIVHERIFHRSRQNCEIYAAIFFAVCNYMCIRACHLENLTIITCLHVHVYMYMHVHNHVSVFATL